jgi:hypothetical protein
VRQALVPSVVLAAFTADSSSLVTVDARPSTSGMVVCVVVLRLVGQGRGNTHRGLYILGLRSIHCRQQ